MTKNELAKEVAVSEKLHLSTTVQAFDGILRVLRDTLAKGETIFIHGFGSFVPTEVAERTARDFKTGKPVVIPAHKSAKFRISKDFIKYLNAEAGKEATV